MVKHVEEPLLKSIQTFVAFKYYHNRTGEDNAGSHLKRQLIGREVVVAITKGNSTSALGSKFFTENSTAIEKARFGEDFPLHPGTPNWTM